MNKHIALRPAIGTALLLSIPLTFTVLDRNQPIGAGWHWSALDFAVMATLLLGAGLAYELFSRRLASKAHRVALGLVILGIVLAIWAELAVGAISQVVAAVAA